MLVDIRGLLGINSHRPCGFPGIEFRLGSKHLYSRVTLLPGIGCFLDTVSFCSLGCIKSPQSCLSFSSAGISGTDLNPGSLHRLVKHVKIIETCFKK